MKQGLMKKFRNGIYSKVPGEQWTQRRSESVVEPADRCIPELRLQDSDDTLDLAQPKAAFSR